MLERLFAPLTRRWGWARTALRVQQRFDELHGASLAAAVTLTAFLSLFPLLLVLIAVVGWFSSQADDLAMQLVERIGFTGAAADLVTSAIDSAEQSRRFATVLGVAGFLWTGLGLVAALQRALNSVWQVGGRGLKDRAVGLLWLVGAAALLAASVAVTAGARWLPGPAWPFALLGSLALGVVLWLWTLHTLANRDVGWKPLLPGAVLGAVGLVVLEVVGAYYVPRAVATSSALYGSLGTVFAVIAWLFFFGRLVVYAAVLNVVRWEEGHGTVTAEIEVPHLPGAVPLVAGRAGDVVQAR
ncbi:MAG TPA: YhjD/YihY/BrkB family envelope integrity protein [Acidimicrobiales bacterium]|nr:YhjD/YihY/BrkB family envelope integrity protein [Acidimicrobiales bacterium]